MDWVIKHWRSLAEARAEQVGWENKWYAWHYPYSRVISVIKGLIIGGLIGVSILCAISITNYLNY